MASLLVKVLLLLFATSLVAFIPRALPTRLPFPERLPKDINAPNHTLIATLFSSKVASLLYPKDTTVFAPPDIFLIKNPYYNLSMLLNEYVAPGTFPYQYLQCVVANYKRSNIHSGNMDKCIQVDSPDTNSTTIVINEQAQLTHPDLLLLHGHILVHGLGGSSFPLRHDSCHASSEFPYRLPQVSPAMSIMKIMVWDIITTAHSMGYIYFANGLQKQYDDIVRLKYMTIFAINDKDLEAFYFQVSGTRRKEDHQYLRYFWGNVVPNNYLLANDLAKLEVGTELPTLSPDRKKLIITRGEAVEINDTRISDFNVFKNARIVVHRITSSFARPQQLSFAEALRTTGGWGEYKEVTFNYDFPPY